LPSKPARPSEPDRDLKSVLFSARPEVIVNATLRDLNSELLSAKPEAELIESLRALARPLI